MSVLMSMCFSVVHARGATGQIRYGILVMAREATGHISYGILVMAREATGHIRYGILVMAREATGHVSYGILVMAREATVSAENSKGCHRPFCLKEIMPAKHVCAHGAHKHVGTAVDRHNNAHASEHASARVGTSGCTHGCAPVRFAAY